MNRHEMQRIATMENRMGMLEKKMEFILHTLALTRKDAQTGATESRTFDTLFEEARKHGMDAAGLANVARSAFTRAPTAHEQTGGSGEPAPFPGAAGDDATPTPGPNAPDAGGARR